MSHRRVVVTGMGAVTPQGNDLASTWEGVVNGRSGIGPVTHFDTTGFTTRIAGQISPRPVTTTRRRVIAALPSCRVSAAQALWCALA